MKLHRAAGIAGAGLAVALVLASCSTAATPADEPDAVDASLADALALDGAEREAALLELAKDEGGLSLYINQSQLDELVIPTFTEKYDIEVTLYRGTEAETLKRAAAEYEAGRHSFDVVGGSAATLQALDDLGAIAEYSGSIRDAMPEGSKVNDMWTTSGFTPFVALYNTDLIAEGEAPTEILDYGDAEWEGRTSFNTEDFEWYQAVYDYLMKEGVSRADFEKAFKAMSSNSQKVKSHLDMTTQLQAGQSDIAINNYLTYVTNAGAKGGPIAAAPYNPVVLRGLNYALAAEAPNPASAVLWLDWVFSEGQNLIWEAGYYPANPEAVDNFENPLPEGFDVVYLDQVADLPRINEWREAYTNLIEGRDGIIPDGVE